MGRLVFELSRAAEEPRAAENFRALCTGERGPGLAYAGASELHRVDPGREVYGGLVRAGGGAAGASVSVFGGRFPAAGGGGGAADGWRPGLLCLVPDAEGRYGSEFSVTLSRKTPGTDGAGTARYAPRLVLGRLTRGFGLLREIEKIDAPRARALGGLRIVGACELEPDEDGLKVWPDGDPFSRWPNDHPQMGNAQYGNRAAAAQSLKAMGNELYGRGEYGGACEKYEKARRYLEKRFLNTAELREAEGAERALQQKLLGPVLLNLCTAYLKLDRPRDTLEACERVRELQQWGCPRPEDARPNPKMLFRRGQAHAMCNEFDEAIADLAAAAALLPEEKAVARELERAKAKKAARKRRERAAYARMFG